MKRFLAACAATVTAWNGIPLLPVGTETCIAAASEQPDAQQFGDALCWSLHDGILTVTGSGSMRGEAPWREQSEPVTAADIGEGVTDLSDHAFYRCENLERVTLPDTLTEIGPSAFAYCTNLKSVTLPDGITEIGESVFRDCKALTAVTLPAGTVRISRPAFPFSRTARFRMQIISRKSASANKIRSSAMPAASFTARI